MAGRIWIKEIIRDRTGKIVDTVCDMDGFRGSMSPQTLAEIEERTPGTVPNIGELFIDEEPEPLTEWKGTKKIGASGNSLSLNVTEACRMMGLERGDAVEVIIRRV